MRYFFRYELEHLITRTGLKLVNIYGDFKENALEEGSKNLIVIAKKIPNQVGNDNYL